MVYTTSVWSIVVWSTYNIEVNIEGKHFIGYGLYHTQWMYVSIYFVHNLCYVLFGTWCTSAWSPLVEPWRDRDQKMEEDMNPHSNWLHPSTFSKIRILCAIIHWFYINWFCWIYLNNHSIKSWKASISFE